MAHTAAPLAPCLQPERELELDLPLIDDQQPLTADQIELLNLIADYCDAQLYDMPCPY